MAGFAGSKKDYEEAGPKAPGDVAWMAQASARELHQSNQEKKKPSTFRQRACCRLLRSQSVASALGVVPARPGTTTAAYHGMFEAVWD